MRIKSTQRLLSNNRIDTQSGLSQLTHAITTAFGKPKSVVLDEQNWVVDYEYSWGVDLSSKRALDVLARLQKEDFEVLVEGNARGVTVIVQDHKL